MPLPVYLAYYFFGLLGAVGMLLRNAVKKAECAEGSPDSFSTAYFLKNNKTKFVLQLLTIGLLIRFSNEALGQEITGWVSVVIGMISGKASMWIVNSDESVKKQ